MITISFLKKDTKKVIYSFSRSLRENEPKEGCSPQGPLDRGMQTASRRSRRLAVGFGIAGRRDEVLNRLRDGGLKGLVSRDDAMRLIKNA